MNEPMLQVEGLRTVLHERERTVSVVRDVSFDVHAGETVALVGESGSGKSLTALSLMGLLPEDAQVAAGRIWLDGSDVLAQDEDKRRAARGPEAAMIYQDPMTSLNPLMRVETQVAEGLEAHGAGRREARERALTALADVGLPRPERTARAYPHQLSGGMRQRVMIAMALAFDPKLLIADEPSTALDVTIQQQILALIDEQRQRRGLAVLWITHDLGVVARLARRVMVMYAGRIVEAGSARDLFSAPQHPYTAGLLGAIPPMRGAQRPSLPQIGGNPPGPGRLPAGCPFHPRCPQRIEACTVTDPPLEARGTSLAACAVPRSQWVD